MSCLFLCLCSSNSISGSSVSFSHFPLWTVPLSQGFTSVGFPVSDSYFFCSNNLLNFVFKHMDSLAFLLLFSHGVTPIFSDRSWCSLSSYYASTKILISILNHSHTDKHCSHCSSNQGGTPSTLVIMVSNL